MKQLIIGLLVVFGSQCVRAAEVSKDQTLIIASFKLNVIQVIKALRSGANVNAKLGLVDDSTDPFYNRWTGSRPAATDSWTPLIALANATDYPEPADELGNVWKDNARSRALRERIPKGQLEQRRRDSQVILYILLSHGCNLDAHDDHDATALYFCVDSGKISLARTLLEFGANPNTKTQAYIDGPNDTTPLHVACNSAELVQLLMDHGADVAAKDSNGKTAADWIALDSQRTFDLVATPGGMRVQRRDSGASPPKRSIQNDHDTGEQKE